MRRFRLAVLSGEVREGLLSGAIDGRSLMALFDCPGPGRILLACRDCIFWKSYACAGDGDVVRCLVNLSRSRRGALR